jgi:proline iminopeptidase
MFVDLNGRRIFFDVDGEKFAPDGPVLREKPTLIAIHGAPGISDHAALKPWFKALRDDMQIIYLDLPGAGRSDALSDPSHYSLELWADDVAAFSAALGIEKPFVLGISGGGFVAQAYAIKYSNVTCGVVFAGTQAKMNAERSIAMFKKLGGAPAENAARALLTTEVTPDAVQAFNKHCMPLYSQTKQDPNAAARMIYREELAAAFHTPGSGIWYTMDLLEDLSLVTCPVLVLAGEEDPITPIEDSEDIVAALTSTDVQFARMAGCGHATWRDKPEESFDIIKEFVARNWTNT